MANGKKKGMTPFEAGRAALKQQALQRAALTSGKQRPRRAPPGGIRPPSKRK